MKKRILSLAGAMALTTASAVAADSEFKLAVVEVKGMACSACAHRLEKVLRKLPDAKNAKVELEKEQATITFAAETKVKDETVKETIRQAGFVPGKLEWRSETQKPDRSDDKT